MMMMLGSSRWLRLLAAARVANLPSVACHVMVGGWIAGWQLGAENPDRVLDMASLQVAAIAGVLLCLGGNLLNDWRDRDWDAVHRPERALPAGLFDPRMFLCGGTGCLAVGMVTATILHPSAGWVAMAVVVCIALYTQYHKASVGSVIPLAMCRGGLPFIGWFVVSNGHPPSCWIYGMAGALFLWTGGLSLMARGESHGAERWRILAWVLLFASPWVAGYAAFGMATPLPWRAMMPAWLWLGFVRGVYWQPIKARVSALLAGLPLVDFVVLASIMHLDASITSGMLWMPLVALGMGRMLQRIASAT